MREVCRRIRRGHLLCECRIVTKKLTRPEEVLHLRLQRQHLLRKRDRVFCSGNSLLRQRVLPIPVSAELLNESIKHICGDPGRTITCRNAARNRQDRLPNFNILLPGVRRRDNAITIGRRRPELGKRFVNRARL